MLTILRGAPGSGKSTLARATVGVVVSADSYFHLRPNGGNKREELGAGERPGPYDFSPAELGFAHGRCFRMALESIQEGYSVVVDNTNTSQVEIAPYLLLAQAFGVEAAIVRIVADIDLCVASQTHDVPEHRIRAMSASLNEPLPPWWPKETLRYRDAHGVTDKPR